MDHHWCAGDSPCSRGDRALWKLYERHGTRARHLHVVCQKLCIKLPDVLLVTASVVVLFSPSLGVMRKEDITIIAVVFWHLLNLPLPT